MTGASRPCAITAAVLTAAFTAAADAQAPEAGELQRTLPGPQVLQGRLALETRPDLAIGVRGPETAAPGETLRFEAELRNLGDAPADLDQRDESGDPVPMVQWAVLKPGQDLNDLFVARPGEGVGNFLDTDPDDAEPAQRQTPRTDFGSIIGEGLDRPDIGERLAAGLLREGAAAEEGIIATETMLGVLEPGRSLRLRVSYRVPAEPPGTYRICAAVDPEAVIAEADESRNIGCVEIHVSVRPDEAQADLETRDPLMQIEAPVARDLPAPDLRPVQPEEDPQD
ncbi:hypothetical protein DDZ18_00935 [Marinicauda salina]|uniref:Uncharacterized protein n=1 Tax=Marinicauda salina TaxID=2135793 RepID=A0A2U2BW09_9PROT|nr:hypothetical protein [Marinicauda salina]PWE18206.1 hypothetical protein DDZ18_00935 [Marinicauda salina]